MSKKAIPRCIYCKRKLGYTWYKTQREKNPEEYGNKRGRCGLGLYCSLTCLEQKTIQRHTGRSVPKGDSHPWLKTEGGEG